MIDLAHMALGTLGLSGIAALWVAKALGGVVLLRVYRRWRIRRRVRLGQGV